MKKGFDLNNEPKKVLSAVKRATVSQTSSKEGGIEIKEEPASFSQIKKETDLHDTQINRGLDKLQDKGLVRKIDQNGPKYKIDENYRWKVMKLARRSRDSAIIESYPHTHIIQQVESNPSASTTIYGLETDTFWKRDGFNLDISKKETLEVRKGIRATEIFGKSFGLPTLSVHDGDKPAKRRDLEGSEELEKMSEEELIERQVDHYREIKENTDEGWEDILRRVIKTHRKEKIEFDELGQSIIGKLESMRKKAAHESAKEEYSELIESEGLDEKVEEVLEEFQKEFLGLLEQVSGALPGAIFIMHGRGCGIANRWPEDMSDEEVESRIQEFGKSVEDLFPEDKSKSDFMPYSMSEGLDKEELGEKQLELIEFLEKVWKRNIESYGVHTSFFARKGKGIYTDVPVQKDKLVRLDKD